MRKSESRLENVGIYQQYSGSRAKLATGQAHYWHRTKSSTLQSGYSIVVIRTLGVGMSAVRFRLARQQTKVSEYTPILLFAAKNRTEGGVGRKA